ncbi:ABC transporter permease subunit [Clavibacter tessellarius]|uniref:ABC transporter permease subunit n=1 Tax=Clavibacter tessellarius TaxID=31965 RepID=UPI0032521DEA
MSQVLYDVPGPRARRRSRILSVVTGVVLVAVLAFAAVKLQQAGQFSADRWLVLNDPLVWGLLLQGLWVVLQSAAVAAVLAILLGMVLALLRMSEHRVVRYAVTVVLEFFRGMPVLLMMLFIYLIFPIGPYWSVVTAPTLYNGAIIGEALRSGILGLPRGQREAGLAIGLRPLQNRLLVEFPGVPHDAADHRRPARGAHQGHRARHDREPRRPHEQGELILEATSRANSLPIFVVMVGMYLVLNLKAVDHRRGASPASADRASRRPSRSGPRRGPSRSAGRSPPPRHGPVACARRAVVRPREGGSRPVRSVRLGPHVRTPDLRGERRLRRGRGDGRARRDHRLRVARAGALRPHRRGLARSPG